MKLLQAEAAAKKTAKEAKTELDAATLEKYGHLTEAEDEVTELGEQLDRRLDRPVVVLALLFTVQLGLRIPPTMA